MDFETDKIIVAVEVRRSCFGYAVFQGINCLLDWGATTPYPLAGAFQRAKKRLLFLLKVLHPAVLVIKKPYKPISRGSILSMVKREAVRCPVSLVTLGGENIIKAFGSCHVKTKYQIATTLTQMFPELVFKLPPIRDTGDSERHAMIVFDAIATGYAHLYSRLSPPPG